MKNLFVALLIFPAIIFAQEGKTFKSHTVAAKENFYSIGRSYHVPPKEIAAYNNLDMSKGLSIGQIIKIPINQASGTSPNVEAEPIKATPAVHPTDKTRNLPVEGTPIYHKVQKKETLYSISVKYGKIPIADLKKWNHLTSDAVNEGTDLIVGFGEKINETNVPVSASVQVQEPVKEAASKPQEIPAAKPEPKKEVEVAVVPEKPEVAVSEVKKPDEVRANKPVNSDHTIAAENKWNGGFFKSKYNASDKRSEKPGTAGVFKSTSGWDDGKFYCLHNQAAAGAIVMIKSAKTQRTIYAKVLDVIPDIKMNENLEIIISNAAAAELGEAENNFEVVVTY